MDMKPDQWKSNRSKDQLSEVQIDEVNYLCTDRDEVDLEEDHHKRQQTEACEKRARGTGGKKEAMQRVHDELCEGSIVKGLGLRLRQRLRGRNAIDEDNGQLEAVTTRSTKGTIPSKAKMELEVLMGQADACELPSEQLLKTVIIGQQQKEKVPTPQGDKDQPQQYDTNRMAVGAQEYRQGTWQQHQR